MVQTQSLQTAIKLYTTCHARAYGKGVDLRELYQSALEWHEEAA